MGRNANRLAKPAADERRELGAWWTPATSSSAARLLDALVLDTDEPWGPALQPWQRTVHAAALGLLGSGYEDRRLMWCDGPTGAGKDQSIAAIAISLLHYAPEGFRCVMLSTDHDRARDVIETVNGFMRRDRDCEAGLAARKAVNPTAAWLGSGIVMTRNELRNADRDVVVKCLATDGASASGERADLFVMNEVQSWADPHGFRVWTEMLARFGKKKRGRIAVLSNLPFTAPGDWRREAWDRARKPNSDWVYVPVRLADCPWIEPSYIELQRSVLPKQVFKRLYECEPTDGRGELVETETYDRAVWPQLAPVDGPTMPGTRVLGVDIGVARDHAVLLMLRLDPLGAVFLERLDVWVPQPKAEDPKKREVQIPEIEAKIVEYGLGWNARVMLDPYQGILLQQRLEPRGIDVVRIDATAGNLTEMAAAVMSLFRDGRMRVWPDAGRTDCGGGHVTTLRQQLLDAELREQEKGIRIVSKRTRLGHGDQAAAFGLAALGVARAGAWSRPVTVGSPREAEASAQPHGCRRHTMLRRHFGRFTGARPLNRRVVG